MKNIYAYTGTSKKDEYYPEFISVNENDEGITISIRSKCRMNEIEGYLVEGNQATISLTKDQLTALSESIQNYNNQQGELK
jgi:hypothetical protein